MSTSDSFHVASSSTAQSSDSLTLSSPSQRQHATRTDSTIQRTDDLRSRIHCDEDFDSEEEYNSLEDRVMATPPAHTPLVLTPISSSISSGSISSISASVNDTSRVEVTMQEVTTPEKLPNKLEDLKVRVKKLNTDVKEAHKKLVDKTRNTPHAGPHFQSLSDRSIEEARTATQNYANELVRLNKELKNFKDDLARFPSDAPPELVRESQDLIGKIERHLNTTKKEIEGETVVLNGTSFLKKLEELLNLLHRLAEVRQVIESIRVD